MLFADIEFEPRCKACMELFEDCINMQRKVGFVGFCSISEFEGVSRPLRFCGVLSILEPGESGIMTM